MSHSSLMIAFSTNSLRQTYCVEEKKVKLGHYPKSAPDAELMNLWG